MSAKYRPLSEYLSQQQADSVQLRFDQIDELVGGLPNSAREHKAWWGNSRTNDSHTWAHLWLAAGWERGELDLKGERVTFVRSQIQRYWWVNHKRSHKLELEGGYIWSPKAKKNGSSNQAYTNLTLVRPGEIVISYANGLITAIGVALGRYSESDKPEGHGNVEIDWNKSGWSVPIEWTILKNPLRPKDFLNHIRGLLPEKYSPLQPDTGGGNQGVYLAEVGKELCTYIFSQISKLNPSAEEHIAEVRDQAVDDNEENKIVDADIPNTEKDQLIRARRGQGLFRQRVLEISPCCALTGIKDESFLIASHLKPWRASSNDERLDGHNGLMLAPHVDRLFDRGWISFDDDGNLLHVEQAASVMAAWGISHQSAVVLTPKQRQYMAYHRDFIFKGNS